MPFDSPDVNLGEMLKNVAAGKVQLPDFQREWKWDTDRIRSLLASISLEYPVGVVMMLEVGGDSLQFLPRPISGVDPTEAGKPEQLVLDGQQRLTSLYQALCADKPVDTRDARGKRLKRWYYLDMARALDPNQDRDEAIIAIPEDHVLRNFRGEIVNDYSTMDKECAAELFPLARIFDGPAVDQWMVSYLQLEKDNMAQRLTRWSTFKDRILKNITGYTLPVIVLKKDTPKDAVCTVFEKVNTGGIVLDVFELLTATFAAENFRLNDDWRQRRERLANQPVLRSIESTDFLQSVALLATYARQQADLAAGADPSQAKGISCRRKDILDLSLDEYKKWSEPVTEALLWAASFLAGEHVFQASDVPYRTQLVPLAAMRVVLGNQGSVHGVMEKLKRWYWCGVLGELYGGTTETRFARDVGEGLEWIHGGAEPITVVEATFNPSRLLTLRTRNSAAYKGIYALLMRANCRDWMHDQSIDLASFFNNSLDIHHIFPKAWCDSHGMDASRRESIVNKTAIAYDTNRFIGGRAPSIYIPALEKRAQIEPQYLDEIVRTHAIEPAYLRNDDFSGFFAARERALLTLIAAAMGKELGAATAEEETPEDFEDEPLDVEVGAV